MGKTNLLYVTWGEVIIDNGIFKNQVVEQLKLIKQERNDLNVFLLSGIPLGNMRLIKRPFYFIKELGQIKRNCAQNGIRFEYRFILALSPWFYTPPQKLRLYDSFQFSFIKKFVRKNKIALVHCRSYTPTRLFLNVRKQLSEHHYKIIFDTRGNFPEEGLLKSHIDQDGYKYWKKLEKQLFDEADAVVNVSGTFTDHVKSITDNPSVHTIYTSTNLQLFQQLPIDEKDKLRASFNIANDQKVLAYLGEISETGWHQRSNLIRIYDTFKRTFVKTKLLLITGNSREELEQAFSADGFDVADMIVVKGSSPKDVNTYLNLADYAVLPFKKIKNELDEILGYTMIASKTGEYLGTGLPVIVNRKIGAASKLVEETGTGLTYDMGQETGVREKLLAIEADKENVSEKCIQTAHSVFDARKNALKYLAIYDDLLSKEANKAQSSIINV